MTFVRWVFYDVTGAVQYVGMQRGNFKRISADDMAAALGLTNYACMEWTEPDADIEAAFADTDVDGNPRIVNVSVDVSGTEPQLLFAYEAVPEQEQSEAEDMAAALTLLGVTPEVDNA